MKVKTKIYALIDPRCGSVFYIGRTSTTLWFRLQGHLRDSRKKHTPKARRIAEIASDGLNPRIELVADIGEASREEACNAEQAWIDFYGLTTKLTNIGKSYHGQHGGVPKVDFPDWAFEKLGVIPDTEIAAEIGVSKGVVRRRRELLGIPPAKSRGYSRIHFSDHYIQMLGNAHDVEIAAMMGVSTRFVREKRISLGILRYVPEVTVKEIPQCVVDVLGVIPDREIERIYGVDRHALRFYREKLGVFRTFKGGSKPRYDIPESIIERLGKVPDGKLAQEIGCSAWTIRNHREKLGIPNYFTKFDLPDWAIAKLGKVRDTELAAELGIDSSVIGTRRERLGIPAFAVNRQGRIDSLPAELIAELGTMSDTKLAEKYGVLRFDVHAKRRELGIKSRRGQDQPMKDLPQEILDLLGKIPDFTLAKKAGVHFNTIKKRREREGIPAARAKKTQPSTPSTTFVASPRPLSGSTTTTLDCSC